MKKSIISLLSVLVIAGVVSSCDLAKFNENKKDPSKVPAHTLFTSALVEYGTFLHQVDVNIGIFQFMAQQWTMTTYTSETRYNLEGRTIAANDWDIFYETLHSLKQASEIVSETPDRAVPQTIKTNRQACIEIMQTLVFSKLVDVWGNVPYKQALQVKENPLPAYADASTIYSAIIDSLNVALGNITTSAPGFSKGDIYYSGNMTKWAKFGNSLKLRMGMMLADVNHAKSVRIVNSAISSSGAGVFTSMDDNAVIPFESSFPDANPVWINVIYSGRDDYVPAIPLVKRMNQLGDPRRKILFTKYNGNYVGGVYGEQNEYSTKSHFSPTVVLPGRPGLILSYSEVQFLLAEAAKRTGYNVTGLAVDHFTKAIKADMKWWNNMAVLAGVNKQISSTEMSDYVAQEVAKFATNWKKTLAIQKWISLFGQYLQAWTSYRRLDYPELDPPPINHPRIDIVPVRYKYPVTEIRYNNPNYKAAAQAIGGDKFTNRLFWDTNPPR